MESLLEGEIDSDIEIITKDQKMLKAHKKILSLKSPVFKEIFKGKLRGLHGNFLDLRDFETKTVRGMLRFLYSCKIEDFDEIAPELLQVSDRFKLDEKLKQMCVNSIVSGLAIKNVVASLVLSNQISETEKLFFKCIQLIAR